MITLADATATTRIGERLAAAVTGGDAIALIGDLGAGKTTLVAGLVAALGGGEAQSPTFSLVNEYAGGRLIVWHVDLYRIEDPSEIEELGLDAAAEAILLVEWPERAGEMWPDALALSLAFTQDGDRILTAEVPPSWEGRWPPR